jgi:hypothetical protein
MLEGDERRVEGGLDFSLIEACPARKVSGSEYRGLCAPFLFENEK